MTDDVVISTKDIKPEHLTVTACSLGKYTLTDDGQAIGDYKTISQDELLSKIKE